MTEKADFHNSLSNLLNLWLRNRFAIIISSCLASGQRGEKKSKLISQAETIVRMEIENCHENIKLNTLFYSG